MSAPNDDALLEHAAREAGLERLLEQDPALLERASGLARDYARRLRRPEAATVEPAHVYRARTQR
jgi:hypothetical protein